MTAAFHLRGTAFVLLDCQEGVAEKVFTDPPAREAFCGAMKEAVEAAQSAGMPCVRVEVEFRPGHPEVSAHNAYFSGVRKAGRLKAGTPQTRPMAELRDLMEPMPRVVKRRIGALTHTDLEPVLRGFDCDGIVLSGLITRGAVLSTCVQAADLDYRAAVLAEVCFDPDPTVHKVLMEEVFPMRAQVLGMSEFRAHGA